MTESKSQTVTLSRFDDFQSRGHAGVCDQIAPIRPARLAPEDAAGGACATYLCAVRTQANFSARQDDCRDWCCWRGHFHTQNVLCAP